MNNIVSSVYNKIDKTVILNDLRIVCESRHASLIGRKEVFMGKAKFGIFGDGKELAQVALSKVFKKGDWRSGYYRDQTWMLAVGVTNLNAFFAQLYAHTDLKYEPATGGRLMNVHHSSRSLDENGNWLNQLEIFNSTTDMSPTSIQMARLLGLAYASKLYRELPELKKYSSKFSKNGNEIAFGSIGDGASAEGIFYETINAAGVLQVPLICSVWDDGYAISVPRELQTTKSEISKALEGFQRTETEKGIEIIKVAGWDYEALCNSYHYAAEISRKEHIPVLVHVDELTQPQGHSTSGSHERYKSKERLKWEAEYDCIAQFKKYIIKNGIATQEEIDSIDKQALQKVKKARDEAWTQYKNSLKSDFDEAITALNSIIEESNQKEDLKSVKEHLLKTINPIRLDMVSAMKKALRFTRNETLISQEGIRSWLIRSSIENENRFNSHLHSESEYSPLKVAEIKPIYNPDSSLVDGREVINACFDKAMQRDPRIFAIGEDVGFIGDVNQGFAGLQEKYGKLRVTDTGIRETTIIGQGIGCAMRGLIPICEIQYLDYIYYGIEPICDDLASIHYRSKGGHKAPMIIRTRGHRLEGVWHSGSPMGALVNSVRGVYLLVPRNLTQAAGFYNTLFKGDNPAIVVECLNAYRQKEKMPSNIGEYTLPLGIPEILMQGDDVTIVTYGAMCKICVDAAIQLKNIGINCEVIDVQSLLPFDSHHSIVKSLKKTGKIIFADEDVPGGTTAFMMQKVIENQGGYYYLDAKPITIAAKEHRPAYSSDGDYFSKPNIDTVFDAVYELMHNDNPNKFPHFY